LIEVVVAAAKDASALGLQEGVYVVGSGSTGAVETFATLGLVRQHLPFTHRFIYAHFFRRAMGWR